jgi:hypothetical protein
MFTIKGETHVCDHPSSGHGPSEPVTIRFDETGDATVYTKTRLWTIHLRGGGISCVLGVDDYNNRASPDFEFMFGCIFPTGTLASILKRLYDYDYEPDLLGSTNVYTFKILQPAETLKVIKNGSKVVFTMRERNCSDHRGKFKTVVVEGRTHYNTMTFKDSPSTVHEHSGKCEGLNLGLGTPPSGSDQHVPIGTYDRLVKLLHNIGDEDHGVDLLGL